LVLEALVQVVLMELIVQELTETILYCHQLPQLAAVAVQAQMDKHSTVMVIQAVQAAAVAGV
jgi:hypothetical protein